MPHPVSSHTRRRGTCSARAYNRPAYNRPASPLNHLDARPSNKREGTKRTVSHLEPFSPIRERRRARQKWRSNSYTRQTTKEITLPLIDRIYRAGFYLGGGALYGYRCINYAWPAAVPRALLHCPARGAITEPSDFPCKLQALMKTLGRGGTQISLFAQ